MKIVTFTANYSTRIGIIADTSVIDLSQAAPELPGDMKSFLEAGETAWQVARGVESDQASRIPLDEVRLEAPILNPGKILAIGLNYADHVAESNAEIPAHQIWFNKQWNAIAGPSDETLIPAVAPDFVDYEAEMCLIIGRRCRHVPRERAHEVIFGYTCGNDVSVRDWQLRTSQYTMGKSFYSHAPIGPWIVTADEFGDPHNKELRCFINGEERQHTNTRHQIFDCFDQIAELSAAFPLDPGDVIFTGTTEGVGGTMKPPRFLAPGDVMRVEIEGIGALENVCAAEESVTLIE